MNRTLRARLGVTVAVLAVGSLLLVWMFQRQDHGQYSAADISAAADGTAVQRAADLRVFFAHQSVGEDLVSEIPAVYAAAEVTSPEVIEVSGDPRERSAVPSSDEGFFAHTRIGENGDPIGKLEEFDAWMRAGMADRVDVAFIKLCYVDLTGDTDADAVFKRYNQTLTSLERDYPDVTFVVVTTPLSTEPDLKARIKGLLGRDHPDPKSNAVRERFNELLREQYGTRVFDVAAFQSTAPDGSRIRGTVAGQEYFALYEGHARDRGHLNDTASAVAAARLMTFLADATAPD